MTFFEDSMKELTSLCQGTSVERKKTLSLSAGHISEICRVVGDFNSRQPFSSFSNSRGFEWFNFFHFKNPPLKDQPKKISTPIQIELEGMTSGEYLIFFFLKPKGEKKKKKWIGEEGS